MMNERIKELATEVGISVEYLTNTKQWTLIEALAELIVRECIASIENADNGFEDYRNQIEDGMRNHCIDLIKNKFGVEE